jgi:RNA polymerase sigma-70 factor (ECF subfamily)
MTPAEFQRIHDSFRPRVLRYLTRLVGERDAEDLAQTVMLRVSGGLSQFRHDSSLSTWIYRIATNAAMDKLRSPVREQALEDDSDPDEGDVPLDARTPSVEAIAIRTEMSACIREFIDHLPERYRTVMVLSEMEGFKNAEIAAILGVSLDTVKIRLHRAREKLRDDLQEGCSFDRDESTGLACDRKSSA